MTVDFKKKFPALYSACEAPAVIEVPPMNFVAVSGKGDPNEPGGAYQQTVGILYGVAYALKTSDKTSHAIEGFYQYVVPPLEGFWQQAGTHGMDYGNKGALEWTSVIRLPEFVTRADFDWAVCQAERKKKTDCSAAEFRTIREGLCVQALHTGLYDTEPETVAAMDRFLEQAGLENDFSADRLHHEIYLSNPKRVAPEKCRTIIRHPVRKRGK